jgi:hypothetical protein
MVYCKDFLKLFARKLAGDIVTRIMILSSFKNFLQILGLTLLCTSGARAYSIGWGDAIYGTDLTSSGAPIDDTFHFELGTFGAFIPDEANLPLWRSSWKILDTTSYSNSTRYFTDTAVLNWNSSNSTYSPAPANVPPPSATFAEGEQVYIWVYNNTNMDASTEWGVFTRTGSIDPKLPNWVLPSGSSDQTSFSLQMLIPDANANPFGRNPESIGLGTSTAPSGSFSYQTHSFVPEPGTAALLVLVGGLGLRRRRA